MDEIWYQSKSYNHNPTCTTTRPADFRKLIQTSSLEEGTFKGGKLKTNFIRANFVEDWQPKIIKWTVDSTCDTKNYKKVRWRWIISLIDNYDATIGIFKEKWNGGPVRWWKFNHLWKICKYVAKVRTWQITLAMYSSLLFGDR